MKKKCFALMKREIRNLGRQHISWATEEPNQKKKNTPGGERETNVRQVIGKKRVRKSKWRIVEKREETRRPYSKGNGN